MNINPITFEHQFRRFRAGVLNLSGAPFTSFRAGLPGRWENYKEWVRREALRRLSQDEWKPGEIGRGRILDRVIDAIEIHKSDEYRNNLVRWTGRFGSARRTHKALLEAKVNAEATRCMEQAFYNFFREDLVDEEAFELLRRQVGPRYDVLAYLHYVLDSRRFMPVAPQTFAEAFKLLGIDDLPARKCSWPSYCQYNDSLQAVRDLLGELVDDVQLVDAHSFCWMLVRMKPLATPPELTIPLPEPIDVSGAGSRRSVQRASELVITSEQFAAQDAERRLLGLRAQQIALEAERRRLSEGGHPSPDLAAIPVWDQVNRGYDILSTEMDGTPRHIEVKAARETGGELSFFISPNELEVSRELANYHLYLVFEAGSNNPVVRTFRARELTDDCLRPTSYLASITAGP